MFVCVFVFEPTLFSAVASDAATAAAATAAAVDDDSAAFINSKQFLQPGCKEGTVALVAEIAALAAAKELSMTAVVLAAAMANKALAIAERLQWQWRQRR